MVVGEGNTWARRASREPAIVTRPAGDADGERCAEIFLAGRRQAFPWQPSGFFRLQDYFDCVRDEAVWVAEVEDRVVGFISVFLPENHIHNLFIDPAWQNRGIGTRLLECALDHMKGPARLECVDRNLAARVFYERKGWIRQPLDDGAGEAYIIYRK